jgi:hypothetical protein
MQSPATLPSAATDVLALKVPSLDVVPKSQHLPSNANDADWGSDPTLSDQEYCRRFLKECERTGALIVC